jgi:hypothetical protein
LTTTPPKSGLGAIAVAGIVVAVLVALGVGSLGAVGIVALSRLSATPVAGDCLHVTKESSNGEGEFEKLSCRDSRAIFRVETREERGTICPGDDYTRLRFSEGSARYTLCLTLNVETGDCLTSIDDETRIAKVGCRTSQAEARVAVSDGDDLDACDDADGAGFLYEGPPERTVCLTEVGEGI